MFQGKKPLRTASNDFFGRSDAGRDAFVDETANGS
jgi:hypothetical protein